MRSDRARLLWQVSWCCSLRDYSMGQPGAVRGESCSGQGGAPMRKDLRESSAYPVMSHLPSRFSKAMRTEVLAAVPPPATSIPGTSATKPTTTSEGASRNFLLYICFSKRIVHLHRVQRVPNAQHQRRSAAPSADAVDGRTCCAVCPVSVHSRFPGSVRRHDPVVAHRPAAVAISDAPEEATEKTRLW